MEEGKHFTLECMIKDGKVATKMSSKNLSPQETIGLLEMAKQQVLDDLKTHKKELFRGTQDE